MHSNYTYTKHQEFSTILFNLERHTHSQVVTDQDEYIGTHFIPDDFQMDDNYYEAVSIVIFRNNHYVTVDIAEKHAYLRDNL